jgi:hypothetical protein
MTRFPARRRSRGDRRHEQGLRQLAERLQAERPLPFTRFRQELRELLSEEMLVETGSPRKPLLAVAAYVMPGAGCLLVAALSVAGVGPLA